MAKVRAMRSGGNFPVLSILNPSRGLNNFMADIDIHDLEAADLLNIEYSEKGNPGTRRGFSLVGNSVDSRVRGLCSYYKADGTKLLLRNSGTALYKMVASVWQTISGVNFTSDLQTNYVLAKDKVFIHNGTDNMARYDGTTLDQPANGVKAKFGLFFNGYHIVAGNPTYPSRIYISNPNDPSDFTGSSGTATAGAATTLTDSTKTWGANDFAKQQVVITAGTGAGQTRTIATNTATQITVTSAWSVTPDATSQYTIASGNWIDISKDDGDKIMGLGKFQNSVIIFKERSIWQLNFDSSGIPTITNVTVGVGCVSHRSVDNVENDLFFLARIGSKIAIYVLGNEPNYFNVIRTNELSTRIAPTLDTITPANLDKASAIYDDYKYMVAIPVGGTTYNNMVVVYDRRYMAFSKWDGFKANSFTQFIDTNNASHLYFGGDSDGKLYEMYQGYNDAGTAINAYWNSKVYNLDKFDLSKFWFDASILLRSLTGTLNVKVVLDGVEISRNVTIGSSATASTGFGASQFGVRQFGASAASSATAPTASNIVKRLQLYKNAKTIQLKVSNNTLDERFNLMGFSFTYIPDSHFRFPSGDKL